METSKAPFPTPADSKLGLRASLGWLLEAVAAASSRSQATT